MRRLLSIGVEVRPAPSHETRQIAQLAGQEIAVSLPSDYEMRNAIARATRELDDMVLAREAGSSGWQVTEFDYVPVVTPEGGVVLRASVVIERPD